MVAFWHYQSYTQILSINLHRIFQPIRALKIYTSIQLWITSLCFGSCYVGVQTAWGLICLLPTGFCLGHVKCLSDKPIPWVPDCPNWGLAEWLSVNLRWKQISLYWPNDDWPNFLVNRHFHTKLCELVFRHLSEMLISRKLAVIDLLSPLSFCVNST